MKKWVRKAISVALSGALLLGASGMAGATEKKLNASVGATTITLTKTYVDANDGIISSPISAPHETCTYTITPYGVWNANAAYAYNGVFDNTNKAPDGFPIPGSTDNIKVNSSSSSSVTNSSVAVNYATTTTATGTITLPQTINFPSVGDYWYTIVETAGSTTGVTYNTNPYYLHIQVTEANTNNSGSTPKSLQIASVTMRPAAPSNNQWAAPSGTGNYAEDTNKVQNTTNTYDAGVLTITKKVAGNAGDTTQRFPVTVTFTKDNNTIVNSDITITGAKDANGGALTTTTINGQYSSSSWTLSNSSDEKSNATTSVTFYIAHDETVTFSNIPSGIKYTVTEDLTGDTSYAGYTNEFSFDKTETGDSESNGSTTDVNNAAGEISGTDLDDTVTITNTKTVAIDVGVITEDAPYMTLMAVCAAAAVLMVARKKRIFED